LKTGKNVSPLSPFNNLSPAAAQTFLLNSAFFAALQEIKRKSVHRQSGRKVTIENGGKTCHLCHLFPAFSYWLLLYCQLLTERYGGIRLRRKKGRGLQIQKTEHTVFL
jgi:hypothetical protein